MEAQQLLLHAHALLEVSNQIGALLFAAFHTVGFQAVHHFHFEFAAFVVGLMVDQATGQIGEWQTQEGRQRHLGAVKYIINICIRTFQLEYFSATL